MNIYIGEPVDDYTAMQGPAPDGFHVPLRTEWQAIVDAGVGLGAWDSSNGVNLSTYLKLPMTGYRYREDLKVYGLGSYGQYLVSTPSNKRNSLFLSFDSSRISVAGTERSTGMTVRCVKDYQTIPTSSWTVLYQGSGNAGIFHNATDGLISISSDGITWYTLMDKNIGATIVYNYGDALSYANCGNYYQRGNNYGFGEDASQITKSSTQVDVTGYGPGNYYESSTWITTTPRQSSANDGSNLRGGVTGVVTKYQEVQNIYIGDARPDYLCFTANSAGSTLYLKKEGSPAEVTLETSTDGNNWNTFTIGSSGTITLANVGDKVYFRNTSETDTTFSTSATYNNIYKFVMTGSISASGDVFYLLNKNSTNTASNSCFNRLFENCTSLTTAPKLPATILNSYCYDQMFIGCSNLTTAPELPATTVPYYGYYAMFQNCTGLVTAPSLPATTMDQQAYRYMFSGCTNLEVLPSINVTSISAYGCYEMFNGCSKIKLSETQTGEYQTPYRIPNEGTGTVANRGFMRMFGSTGGTYTSDPAINTTYYTSNTVV